MAASSGAPSSRRGRPPYPHESHGHQLSTTPEAAEWYQTAQLHSGDRARVLAALHAATVADPGYPVAAIDLSAFERRSPVGASGHLTGWERHHVDIVAAAASGDVHRAVDLLRDHLVTVGCDPIAVALVLAAGPSEPVDDLLDGLPACHCPSPSSRGHR